MGSVAGVAAGELVPATPVRGHSGASSILPPKSSSFPSPLATTRNSPHELAKKVVVALPHAKGRAAGEREFFFAQMLLPNPSRPSTFHTRYKHHNQQPTTTPPTTITIAITCKPNTKNQLNNGRLSRRLLGGRDGSRLADRLT